MAESRSTAEQQKPWDLEVPESSGVHVSDGPSSAAEWRAHVESSGELSPAMAAALDAFSRLEKRAERTASIHARLAQTVDRLPFGMALLDGYAVVHVNAEGSRLIDGAGFRITPRGQLEGVTEALQRRFAEACVAVETGREEMVAFRVPRHRGDCHAVVVRLGESEDGLVVLMTDPNRAPAAYEDVLRAHYGFTPTEARVAVRLVLGLTPREIAEKLQVGVETTRTHVKHILGKMKCHRQVDAVRKLVLGPSLYV
ncbi:MAG: helix-turn-helix transcriptional regulator [Myxococcota bacterium]